jgi:hypothetical protein
LKYSASEYWLRESIESGDKTEPKTRRNDEKEFWNKELDVSDASFDDWYV